MTTPPLSSTAKPWYRRPRVTTRPDRFDTLLADTMATLRIAAAHAPCVLASSLSADDMALFHLIQRERLPISTFALDTRRLPRATLDLWQAAESHYAAPIERVTPTCDRRTSLNAAQAESAIYENKAARELCCAVRKTEPLRTALAGKRAWVTGLRRAQSAGRANVPRQERDVGFGLEKFNPLADWSDEALWFFIDSERVPVSTLYENGYASIGCDPCTRPIRFDEHPRAGRWWWEATVSGTATECGIHVAHNIPDATAHQPTGVPA
ncbi:MAG: phosphoadenylyl-sulfate reductase [Burkholderiales bacterium]|nr:phosphoadenylyl-sulfate reductase [Burkholderiales bacterium]